MIISARSAQKCLFKSGNCMIIRKIFIFAKINTWVQQKTIFIRAENTIQKKIRYEIWYLNFPSYDISRQSARSRQVRQCHKTTISTIWFQFQFNVFAICLSVNYCVVLCFTHLLFNCKWWKLKFFNLNSFKE